MSISSFFLAWAMSLSAMAGIFPETESPEKPGTSRLSETYGADARKIFEATMAGNDAYRRLEHLCLRIGPRMSGTPEMFRAATWAFEEMLRDGHENVTRQKVMVPRWVRGKESATILSPRKVKMAMLGLGGSVPTHLDGVTASVVVINKWTDMDWFGREGIEGKIVLFNHAMRPYDPERGAGYGDVVEYRVHGASRAAAFGAAAVLVRSITANSLRTPHTGALRYDSGQPKIPAASISIEDAEMIARLVDRKNVVTVNLKMQAKTLPDSPCANVIGELRGSTYPDEIVVIGGHLDSWDVGQGAHDDAGGCVIAMEAISVLRRLKLIPKRTIRVVLWTNEEFGLAGARAYVEDRKSEMEKHVAAIESDSGVFRPTGFSVECSDAECQRLAAEQTRDIMKLLEPLGSMRVQTGYSGADVGLMRPHGVVLMGHQVEGSTYFDLHHSPADTVDKVDPTELSMNVAALATVAYVIADMPGRIGRTATTPEAGSK